MGNIESKKSPNIHKYPAWRKFSEAGKAVVLATLLASSSCSCEKDDIVPPTIEFNQVNTKDVEIWSKIEVRWSDVYIWWKMVAKCTDNEWSPRTSFTYDGKNISVVEKDGVLLVLSTDDAWNKSEKKQQVTVKEAPILENQAPIITPEKYSDWANIKVGWWFRFFHEWNSISIESQGKKEKCFSYSDRETSTENLKPTFTIDWQPIEFGKWYTEWNTVKCEIEDDGTVDNQDEKAQVKQDTITYTLNNEILDNDVLSWLDKLNSLQLKVWETTDLLNWVSGINWWTISKVEIEQNWQRTEISSTNGRYNYTPAQEWTAVIIVTGTTGAWVSYEVKSNQIEVKENILEWTYNIPEMIDTRDYTGWNSYKNNVDIYKWPNARNRYEIYEKNWHVLNIAILKALNALWWAERQEELKNRELVMMNEQPEQWNPETDWLRIPNDNDYTKWDTHWTTRVEIIKNNSKRIPWIAQDFPNKILCIYEENGRKKLYNLVSSNPNKKYIIYLACNDLKSKNFNDFEIDKEWTRGYYLKELLNLPNAVLINCILNNENENHNSLNQNQPPQDNWRYGTFSFNWNQIVTVWCNNTEVFHSYDRYKPEFKDYYSSWIPVWYKYVIASPRYPYDEFWKMLTNEYNTTSSFQNAVTTGTFVNYSMQKPSMTISELMEMNENSLEDVKEIYHNDNEPLTGTNIKYQDSYKFARDLHYPTFPEHISSTEITDLSGYFETDMPIWLTYPWIEAYIDWQWQPTFTNKNFTDSQKLEVSISKKYRFNPELCRKQGFGKNGNNQIGGKMFMLNENGKWIDENPNSPTLYLN